MINDMRQVFIYGLTEPDSDEIRYIGKSVRPPPKSVADELREMPAGDTRLFPASDYNPDTIRSTITRLKREGRYYTTRPETGGLRVWRLA